MPPETARAAHAILGRSNLYVQFGEHLETILENVQLTYLWEKEVDPQKDIAILALITFFQFVEGLTDVQAADAVRTRTDWKFALHLPLIPGIFHENILCEFRHRVFLADISREELQQLLDRLLVFTPSPYNSFQKPNALELVSLVCSLNRLDRAQQAMQQALEILAAKFPSWLRKVALPHWYGRYNHITPRLEVAVLLGQQRFLMDEIGADIHHLLEKIYQSGSHELSELHEVKTLDQLWSQQFKTLNFSTNYRPENLNLKDCDTCTYRSTGRRLQA